MLKPNDSNFDQELKNKCPFPGVSFKPTLPLNAKQSPDPHNKPLSSISTKKLKKYSLEELSEDYIRIPSLSNLIESKTGLSDRSCLSKQIDQGKKENEKLLIEHQELENILYQKFSSFEEEKEASKQVEKKLNFSISKKAEEYNETIRDLNTKLNALNKRLSLYEDFLKLSVKKSKDEYICTANPGLSEVVFSFKFEGQYAIYSPIKVDFDPHDMLNFRLSNITKKEISVIFNRLRKAYNPISD